MDIEGKTAVITGGSAGIGLAIANALADAGIGAIVIGDIDDANGEAAVAGIIDKGAKSVYKHTDVSNADDIRALFDEAVKNFGQVDIVFNNAGIMLGEPAWPEVAIERLGLGVQINLLGVMYGTRVAIDVLSQSGGGLIINTASPAGFGPLPPDPMYAATKAAIINFTPAPSAAEIIDLASSIVRAIGFSSRICFLPAAASKMEVMGCADVERVNLGISGGVLI